MIKILHLTHAFFPDRSGTAERIFYSQPLKGYKHFIIKSGNENKCYKHEEFVVYVFCLPKTKKSRSTTKKNAKILANFAQKIIENHNIDIIYGHNPLLFSLATLYLIENNPSLSLIYEPHNLLYSHYKKRISEKKLFIPKLILKIYHRFLIKIEKKLMIRSSIIISQTEALKSEITKLYSLNGEKVIVAYNGIPEIEVNKNKKKIYQKYNLTNQKYIIYGGDLSENNGLSYIIKLIEKNSNLYFIIAGKGVYSKILDKISKKHKNLLYFGILKKKEYLELLSISDILLILRKSDITNNNYLPLKILDAIFLQKKVITTNLKIMREVSELFPLIFMTNLEVDNISDKIKEVINFDSSFVSPLECEDENFNFNWNKTKDNISNAIQKIILKKT